MIKNWLSSLFEVSSFKLDHISLKQSDSWSLKNGSLRHNSDKFFKVTGLRWLSSEGKVEERPFLDQREIGTLGFIVREKDSKHEILIQAKIEPGNISIIQLAPTCQATESNAKRVHGGNFPPFIEYFNPTAKEIIYDVLQSEQGTRFFCKRNRNALIFVKDEILVPSSHRWLKIEEMLDLLHENYIVNTDARSVLVSAPWKSLVGRAPFSRYKNGFGSELFASANDIPNPKALNIIKSEIKTMRNNSVPSKIIGLHEMKGFKINRNGHISFPINHFQIKQIKVAVLGREVKSWDQPIIDSANEGRIILICGRSKKGILKFLFRANREPGLFNHVELTPTIVIEPGLTRDKSINIPAGKVVAECLQSEEGSRFYQDTNYFSIIDTGNIYEVTQGYYWLTLEQIRKLLDEEGWFTNEARSALSLLLPWM